MNELVIMTLRLALATITGSIIGIERTIFNKAAGVRTHAILALATCSLTILAYHIQPEQINRVIAGIVQGISFIGAGVIFTVRPTNDEKEVVGITSSAILWLTGILGIISATDYYYLVPIILVLYWIINYPLRWLEKYIRIKKGGNNNE